MTSLEGTSQQRNEIPGPRGSEDANNNDEPQITRDGTPDGEPSSAQSFDSAAAAYATQAESTMTPQTKFDTQSPSPPPHIFQTADQLRADVVGEEIREANRTEEVPQQRFKDDDKNPHGNTIESKEENGDRQQQELPLDPTKEERQSNNKQESTKLTLLPEGTLELLRFSPLLESPFISQTDNAAAIELNEQMKTIFGHESIVDSPPTVFEEAQQNTRGTLHDKQPEGVAVGEDPTADSTVESVAKKDARVTFVEQDRDQLGSNLDDVDASGKTSITGSGLLTQAEESADEDAESDDNVSPYKSVDEPQTKDGDEKETSPTKEIDQKAVASVHPPMLEAVLASPLQLSTLTDPSTQPVLPSYGLPSSFQLKTPSHPSHYLPSSNNKEKKSQSPWQTGNLSIPSEMKDRALPSSTCNDKPVEDENEITDKSTAQDTQTALDDNDEEGGENNGGGVPVPRPSKEMDLHNHIESQDETQLEEGTGDTINVGTNTCTWSVYEGDTQVLLATGSSQGSLRASECQERAATAGKGDSNADDCTGDDPCRDANMSARDEGERRLGDIEPIMDDSLIKGRDPVMAFKHTPDEGVALPLSYPNDHMNDTSERKRTINPQDHCANELDPDETQLDNTETQLSIDLLASPSSSSRSPSKKKSLQGETADESFSRPNSPVETEGRSSQVSGDERFSRPNSPLESEITQQQMHGNSSLQTIQEEPEQPEELDDEKLDDDAVLTKQRSSKKLWLSTSRPNERTQDNSQHSGDGGRSPLMMLPTFKSSKPVEGSKPKSESGSDEDEDPPDDTDDEEETCWGGGRDRSREVEDPIENTQDEEGTGVDTRPSAFKRLSRGTSVSRKGDSAASRFSRQTTESSRFSRESSEDKATDPDANTVTKKAIKPKVLHYAPVTLQARKETSSESGAESSEAEFNDDEQPTKKASVTYQPSQSEKRMSECWLPYLFSSFNL